MVIAEPAVPREDPSLTTPTLWQRSRTRLSGRGDVVCWVLICLGAIIVIERLRAPSTFYFDEWTFVFDRRSGGVDSLLEGHNGHLSILPVLAYKVGFAVFGLDHYRPFRLLGLLVHALVATLVYRYVRARLGPLAGLAAGLLVLLLGAGWQNILWPFQIGFMGSVAAGIGAWMLLDRDDRRSDLGVAVLTGVALSCSGLGIPIFVGVFAHLVAHRAWHRLLPILAAPALLYGAWYLVYGESEGTADNIPRLPRFMVDEGATSVAGLGGRDLLWGRLLFGILIGFAIVVAGAQRHRSWGRVVAPAAGAVALWALIGYSRAQYNEPGSSRYVYVGGILVVLVAADLLVHFRSRVLAASVVVVCLLGVWGNWRVLHTGARGLQSATHITRSELRAVEWAADTVDPSFRPDEANMPQVFAGQYLDAVDDLGSPAATDDEVAGTDLATRSQADHVSLGALRFAPVAAAQPDDPGQPLPADNSVFVVPASGCSLLTSIAGAEAVGQIVLPEGSGVVIATTTTPLEVRLKRYADGYPVIANAVIESAQAATIAVTPDDAPRTDWILELRSADDFSICAAGG